MKQRFNLFTWKMIVTGFGSGYIPFAPGTMGSVGALVAGFLIITYLPQPDLLLLFLVLLFTILGIAGATKMRYHWGKDPSRIVVDEMVGMWISLLWTGHNPWQLFLALVLFRFFDICKPLGIRKTEALPGGLGVMADDILAGIYTNIVLQLTGLLVRSL